METQDINDLSKFTRRITIKLLRQNNTLGEFLSALSKHHAVHPNSKDVDAPVFLNRLFPQVHIGQWGQIVNSSNESGEDGYPLDEMYVGGQLSSAINAGLYKAANCRWSPLDEDLRPLVDASQVVPPNYNELVTTGLLFALKGDFMLAASLLAPMPEVFFRDTLLNNGILAPYTQSNSEQMLITLGSLLDPEQPHYAHLVNHFGEDLMLDAKRVLDLKSLNVRNVILHGLQGEGYAASWPGITLIQLVFRLVFGKLPDSVELSNSVD